MARVASTLEAVLAAVRDRLTPAVFGAGRCFLTLDPDDCPGLPPDGAFAGVTFGDFEQPATSVTTESPTDEIGVCSGEIVVAVWVRVALDQPHRDDSLITDQTIGATLILRQVLAELSNQELTDASGDEILMKSLTFVRLGNRGRAIREAGAVGWRRFDVRFECLFRWDLT